MYSKHIIIQLRSQGPIADRSICVLQNRQHDPADNDSAVDSRRNRHHPVDTAVVYESGIQSAASNV